MGIFGKLFKPNIEKLKKRRDVEGLIKALEHSDWWTCQRAAEALGEIGGPRATEALIELLGNSDERKRGYAVRALGKIGDVRAVNSIIGTLSDTDWHVRLGAVEALGQIKDRKVIAPLMKALGDEASAVRKKAAKALGGFRLKREKILEEAKKAFPGRNFYVLCEKCGEPCEVEGRRILPEALRVIEPHTRYILARYCKKCNIVVCSDCARVGKFSGEQYLRGFFGACPDCGGVMEFACADDVKKTETIVVGAFWLDPKEISEVGEGK